MLNNSGTSSLGERKDCHADRIGDNSHANNLCRKNQPTRHIDYRIHGEENRKQGHAESASRGNLQPKWRARTNGARACNRNGEEDELDDPIENICGIVHELKCFLDSGADLA